MWTRNCVKCCCLWNVRLIPASERVDYQMIITAVCRVQKIHKNISLFFKLEHNCEPLSPWSLTVCSFSSYMEATCEGRWTWKQGVCVSFFSSPFLCYRTCSCHRVSHSNDARSSTASSGPISGRLIRCWLTNPELNSLRVVQMTMSFTDISARCPSASLAPWSHRTSCPSLT